MDSSGAVQAITAMDGNLSGSSFRQVWLCGAVIKDFDTVGVAFDHLTLAGSTFRKGTRLAQTDLSEVSIENCTSTGMRIDGIMVETLLANHRKIV